MINIISVFAALSTYENVLLQTCFSVFVFKLTSLKGLLAAAKHSKMMYSEVNVL